MQTLAAGSSRQEGRFRQVSKFFCRRVAQTDHSLTATLLDRSRRDSERTDVEPHIGSWRGRVCARSDAPRLHLTLRTPGNEVTNIYKGPFRGIASDNREYFIKTLETCKNEKVGSLATEYIVSKVGQLIDAPVRQTALIVIPDAFDGYQFPSGLTLRAGIAHGSLAVERFKSIRPKLESRSEDDNRKRHVGAFALYDWCYGSDAQWLLDLSSDSSLYSHDHGEYFPTDSSRVKSWTREMLILQCDSPMSLPDSVDDLSPGACEQYAESLERVTREQLVAILNNIPKAWPVSDTDLEDIGWFLEYRAPKVADRVRQLSSPQGSAR